MSNKSDEVTVFTQHYDVGLNSREQITTKLLAGILSQSDLGSSYDLQLANIKEALQYADLLLEITRKKE